MNLALLQDSCWLLNLDVSHFSMEAMYVDKRELIVVLTNINPYLLLMISCNPSPQQGNFLLINFTVGQFWINPLPPAISIFVNLHYSRCMCLGGIFWYWLLLTAASHGVGMQVLFHSPSYTCTGVSQRERAGRKVLHQTICLRVVRIKVQCIFKRTVS